MLKTVFINLAIFLMLLGLVVIVPPTTHLVFSAFKDSSLLEVDPRSQLPNYQDYEWAEKHFSEFYQSKTSYHDYIVWRRDDFAGETVNVVDGLRVTRQLGLANDVSKFKFFGGSTMWGQGVDDINTIPSVYAMQTGQPAENYGEVSYVARQSLALLSNRYIQETEPSAGDHVVFYDGVNEVLVRCRSEVSALGTDRENQISQRSSHTEKWSFMRPFTQLIDFLGSLRKRSSEVDPSKVDATYNCDNSEARAEEVATTLVNTWLAADALAKSNGDIFSAVLQPVAFIGQPNTTHLDLSSPSNQELAKNYRAVYPKILARVRQTNLTFYDLTRAYDGEDLFYIDFCHASPQAHQRLVAEFIQASNGQN